jgi:hypothetical protein
MEILEEKVHLWTDSARFVKAKSGIYVLYDRKLGAIFIGESDNLQSEFSKYFILWIMQISQDLLI